MRSDQTRSMEHLALVVWTALEDGDLESFADMLDSSVRWGPPGDPSPPCQSRDQVLSWYQRGQARGTSASVNNVTILGGHLLVELVVRGTDNARGRGGAALRWQILTVQAGRITDIVGFDDRAEAIAYVEDAVPNFPPDVVKDVIEE